jgi:hypothetical protein
MDNELHYILNSYCNCMFMCRKLEDNDFLEGLQVAAI